MISPATTLFMSLNIPQDCYNYLIDHVYYVYLLKSLKKERVYVGYSGDLRVRVEAHNLGKVRSTKYYRPWRLVYYESYLNQHDATKREKQLKLHAAKEVLLKQIATSLDGG